MPLRVPLHSFTGGEWAPSLYGRSDLAKYATACRRMLNFYPHPHGGASNRGGTQFIGEVQDSSKKVRLIPFQFSVVQAYMLEFGNGYMRVIKDGGYVVMTLAGTTAWLTSTVYSVGDFRKESNKIYYCLTGHTSGTFATDLAAGKWILQDVYQMPAPYLEADLPLLKYEQSADTMYLWHPSYDERKLTRTGHSAWALSQPTFAPSISAPTNLARGSGSGTGYTYVVTAINASEEESVASNAVSGGRSDAFTWTSVSGAVRYDFYEGLNGVYGFIGSSTTTSYTVPASPAKDEDISPPEARNPFSGSGDKPGCGAFHEQRLVRARTNNKPQSVFGSVTGSFENMCVSSPIKADDAFGFTINSKQVNEIRWIVSLNDLIIGTSGSEWKMNAGSTADAIGPTAVSMKVQSRFGVSHVQPLVIGSTMLFLEGSGAAIRDLAYSLEADGYKGNQISILANHFFENMQITRWCYQQHPDSVIWCVRNDGALIGLTYMREHEIWGWHEHETDGVFEDCATITTSEGVDEVYLVVKRTIDGNVKRYVERFMPRLPSTDIADAYFVDCGLTYDGAPNDDISGLDHLEGKEVAVLADGNVVKGLTVVNGAIKLPHEASLVHIGLPYSCVLTPMAFVFNTNQGTVQGEVIDVASVVVRLSNTREIWVGPENGDLFEMKFRTDEDYGDPTRMFTGQKEISIAAGAGEEAVVTFEVTDPVPCTVLEVVARIDNGDV
jgi:hypothetical protein